MKKLRVYIDTSVIGGCEDDEFKEFSRKLIDCAKADIFKLLVSDLLVKELSFAPNAVKNILRDIPDNSLEYVTESEEALSLEKAYLDSGILGEASANDALHVALATLAGADLIVSWNFKHIVHYDKIRLFNAVNLREGYGFIDIRSPLEVV